MEITFKSTDILSISEAAKQLGITRMTLYRWIDKGKIQSLMFGGYRAIPVEEVERLKAAEK
jgi:excisionase family DNA binding protein